MKSFIKISTTIITLMLASVLLSASLLLAKEGGAATIGEEGAVELTLNGKVDLDPDDNTVAYYDMRLGYFFIQGVNVGILTMQGTDEVGQRDSMGLFGEYIYDTGTMFYPFAGGSAKYVAGPRNYDGGSAKVFGFYAGSNIRLASNVALSLTFTYEFADHPVLGASDEFKKRNRDLTAALKFYF